MPRAAEGPVGILPCCAFGPDGGTFFKLDGPEGVDGPEGGILI